MKNENILPNWLGKTGVSETLDGTIQLAKSLTDMMEYRDLTEDIKKTDGDIPKLCDLFNTTILNEIPQEGMAKVTTRIFVGFPESPLGRLNASLGGTAFALREYLANKEKYDSSIEERKESFLNTGFK
jgi:hypothetical protein